MNYWLVKTEPDTFSWDNFVSKNGSMWDGVRNFQARNNLKLMKKFDKVLFYHSNIGLEIVGLAEVKTEFYADPTADTDKWVVVDLIPVKKFNNSVKLSYIKTDPLLEQMALVKNTRLSVQPVLENEFNRILELANEKIL